MNKNIYNYKYVTEYILPVIDRNKFGYDFAIAIEQKQSYIPKILGDMQYQVITDVNYFVTKNILYKDIPDQKYKRLWNAFCFTYWSNWHLDQSVIDPWGYVKWRDMGYEPPMISSAEDAYSLSEKQSSSEPSYFKFDG